MSNKGSNLSRPTINAALSTMWGIGRCKDLDEFFRQGSQMGFPRFELNHRVTPQMLAGIDLSSLSIPIVHEPCPAEIDAHTLKERDWLVSSLDEDSRSQGVKVIKRSIDLARNLGSQAIVIHCGHIPGLREIEDQLWTLFRAGKSGTSEYEMIKDGLIRSQSELSAHVLEAVLRSLTELEDYARPFGIHLGLENRYHFSDFPNLQEMKILLDHLSEETSGFWYDVGHAQTLDRLGFYPHSAWLQTFKSRLLGVHFHDVIGLDDHQAPGAGEVDWDMVASYLPDDCFHTLEVQNFNSPQQIKDGVQFLTEKKCLSILQPE